MQNGQRWVPVPYYFSSPLSKLKPLPPTLPHKLGFIPKFLEKRNQIKIDPKKN